MRSVTVAPPRRFAAPFALAAIACAALAACSFDLELPALPTSPTVSKFLPGAAYAGELIRLTGTQFDPDPGANTVNFALASARALRFDGGALVVRVPADAGSGTITVTSRSGTSAPTADSFTYRGLGEPRRGQVISSTPILHHPRRIHSVYYKTFIESQLYGTRQTFDAPQWGLVGYRTDTRGPDPFVSTSTTAPWRSLLLYSVDDATGTTVTMVNEIDGTWKKAHLDGVQPWRLVVVRGATQADDLLVTFQTSAGLSRDTMAVWSLAGLLAAVQVTAPTIPENAVSLATPDGARTVRALTGPVDTGDGRVAMVASTDELGGTLGIALIDFRARPDYFLLPPAGLELDALVSDPDFDGLAAGPRGPSLSSAIVFALKGGRVGYLDFDFLADPTGNMHVTGTYSASQVRGLALAASDTVGRPLAIATKPDDDLVLGIHVQGATVAWGLPTRSARHVVVDHSVSSTVWVANDGDNDVLAVNTATGRQVGRLSFDVAPTSISVATGAAFAPPDPLALYPTDELYLVAGNPPAVLVHPLGFAEQACAWRPPWPAALVRDPASRAIWGAAEGATATDPIEVADLSGILPAFATGAPIGVPADAAYAGGHLVVAHDGGLTAVAGGAVTGTWTPPAQPRFYNLGATPGGELVVAAEWDGLDRVQLWDPARIASSGAPLAEWTAGSEYVDWAVWLEDGLWAQHADYSTMTWTVSRFTREGSSLVEVERVTPVDPIPYFAGTTPNGRALVRWENRAGGGTALRLFSADPGTGFAETAYVALDGVVAGLAFDASGEHAYVVTRGPDRVVTID
jgi:hypothetical protein